MHPALAILWFGSSVVFGVGTIITIVALRRAPTGYENEEGFQYFRPSNTDRFTSAEEAADVVHPTGAGLA